MPRLRLQCLLVIAASIGPAFPQIRETGCPAPDQVRVPPEALKGSDFVSLHRSACYGPCPVYTLQIRADGEVMWKGESSVHTQGEASETVSADRAKALIERFRSPAIGSLCNGYSQLITDYANYKTTVSIAGNVKQVSEYANSAPEFLRALDREIDSLANSHLWRHGDPKSEFFEVSLGSECYLPKPGVTPLMCLNRPKTATLEESLRKGENVNGADSSG